MNVRKITKTTLSLIILITGFVFFSIFYIKLISGLFGYFSNGEDLSFIFKEKLFPNNYIGSYFPMLFYLSIIIILTARILDVILERKAAFSLLTSFVQPLLFTVIITIILFIKPLNILQIWAIFYVCILVSLHTTLKKTILHSETAGPYSNLKLIKGFIITIRDTAKKVILQGVRKFRNPVDEITILSISCIIILLEAISVISLIIFLTMHWRLIFLSHLSY